MRKTELEKRAKTLSAKTTKLKPDSRPTGYAHLYENKGWVNLLKFDLKVDDLEVESFVRKEYSNQIRNQKKHSSDEIVFLL